MKTSLTDLLFGPPGRRLLRVRSAMTLGTLGLYCLFALLQQVEVSLGLIDARESAWLILFYVGGSLAFYLLVRTGWSERLAVHDPSLTLPQAMHGLLAMVGAYAITGPARGAVLAILVLVLAYGMFSLSVAQARLLALLCFVTLTLTMGWKIQTDPLRYPFWVEMVHLSFGVIVLLGISALSVRMGKLRQRLHQQKQELEASLEQIRLLATRDELTGLVNRRHMMELLRAEQVRQQRTGKAMSLAMLDLDHFKRINDSFGHQAGDTMLRTFAHAAVQALRGSDVLSRWGGEEFLLLLPQTDRAEALNCVQRMRDDLDHVVYDAIAPGLRQTFSAGLAICQPGESIEAMIEQADQALYRAKEAGRNCTVVA